MIWRHNAALHRGRTSFVNAGKFRLLSTNLRVLFFGTDNISLESLKILHANMVGNSQQEPLIKEIEVICPPDKRMARSRNKLPVPVKKFALDNGIPVHHIPDNVKSLKDWEMPTSKKFDVGVVVSFGYFIHPHMLVNVTKGAINMHPSLLPKYRGPAPIPRALLHGDDMTGISVIEIDPTAFDVGRILHQEKVHIPRDATYLSLSLLLAQHGAKCVIETLKDLDTKKAQAIVQDDSIATKAPKMKREHGLVTWTETSEQLFNKWRAVGETFGVVASFGSKEVKFIHIQLPDENEVDSFKRTFPFNVDESTIESGTFTYDKSKKALWVRFTDKWILVTQLQPADRKVFSAVDFANGNQLKSNKLYSFDRI